MTAMFEKIGLTRDSLWFFWSKIVALSGLVLTGVWDPASLGLTDRQKHIVMVACGAIAYLAGQMSTSTLPSKADALKVNLSKIGTGIGAVLLACAFAGASLPACASAPPTKVAAVADVGARIEASAGALLSQAQTAQATINPATGRTFITRDQLDVVALAVDKVGRLGLTLNQALGDYNTLKAAGKDATSQVAAVQGLISDLTSALQTIGRSIPSGTVQSIDAAVTSVFAIIAEIRAGVSLS